MTPIQRNDLRAKAMAATKGPWIAGRTDIVIADSKGSKGSKGMVICSLEQCLDRRTNSDYIASASPDVILALLTQLEEYEEALKYYANEEEWIDFKAVCADGTEVNSHFDGIQGQRARDALAKYQGHGG